MILIIFVLVIGLCFCIYNYWFQKEKYKRITDEEAKKLNSFNSPNAWLLYTIIFLITVLGTFGYSAYNLFTEIFKLNQY